MKTMAALKAHKLASALLAVGLGLLVLGMRSPAAHAEPLIKVTVTLIPAPTQTATPSAVVTAPPAATTTPQTPHSGNDTGNISTNCLMCHSYDGLQGVAENGDSVSLHVDGGQVADSVHGKADLGCVACHADITGYPHGNTGQIGCSQCHGNGSDYTLPVSVTLPYASGREMTLALNETCRRCHEEQFTNTQDSAHTHVLASGNEDAPVCTDCHGSHDIHRPDQPKSQEALICAKCHEAVYSSYKTSVHGQALINDENPDVPTCVSCHGVHNIQGPRDKSFRDDSITTCGGCHANKELMAKYGISADVFQTYLDDFHGRTVNLTREEANALPSNKAVCYDCHGIHNILPPDNPESSVNPANLMKTCQQCHADANSRFPSAWLGHKVPSFQSSPALYGVTLFYKLVIPATLGFFAVYIGLDWRKRRQDHRVVIRRALSEESLQQKQPASGAAGETPASAEAQESAQKSVAEQPGDEVEHDDDKPESS